MTGVTSLRRTTPIKEWFDFLSNLDVSGERSARCRHRFSVRGLEQLQRMLLSCCWRNRGGSSVLNVLCVLGAFSQNGSEVSSFQEVHTKLPQRGTHGFVEVAAASVCSLVFVCFF